MTTNYCTVSDIATRTANANLDPGLANQLIGSASRAIDDYCGRRFYADSAATARLYDSPGGYLPLYTDDISEGASLIVKIDTNHDGIFETTASPTEYVPQPLNQIVGGIEGFPYTCIAPVPPRFWPISYPYVTNGRSFIQVTAKWGWPAVPDAITSVCIEAAARRLLAPLGAIHAETIGTYQVQYDPAEALVLLDADKLQLDRYSKRLGI